MFMQSCNNCTSTLQYTHAHTRTQTDEADLPLGALGVCVHRAVEPDQLVVQVPLEVHVEEVGGGWLEVVLQVGRVQLQQGVEGLLHHLHPPARDALGFNLWP